jgi:hypothetical protein
MRIFDIIFLCYLLIGIVPLFLPFVYGFYAYEIIWLSIGFGSVIILLNHHTKFGNWVKKEIFKR